MSFHWSINIVQIGNQYFDNGEKQDSNVMEKKRLQTPSPGFGYH